MAVFLAATNFSAGEIVVNDVLSFEGFVNMSYAYTGQELDATGGSLNESENNFGVDEVEIAWLFDFEPITARIEIEHEENGDDLEVEQAFVVYKSDSKFEGSAITAGRYASMLGFEAYEQPNLYQFTTAYGTSFNAVSNALEINLNPDIASFFNSVLFPVGERYSQGVKYTFENDTTFFGFSIQDGTINYENRLGGDDGINGSGVDDGGYGFETALVYNCDSGLSVFLGGSYEIGDGLDYSIPTIALFTTGDTETYIVNTYATYEFGVWLFAAELNYSQTELEALNVSSVNLDIESITGLIMANYAYNENASVTGRISYADVEIDPNSGASTVELDDTLKYTIAHNYAFMDNIILITEFSYLAGEIETAGGDIDTEELFAGAELIFVF